MLKFLKMTVVEDVTIMEEVQVEVLVAEEVILEVQLQEEKVVLLQEEKVQADLEATEILLQEKVVLEATETQLQEKVVSEARLQEAKVVLIELQDVLKALVIHQDQEDQEETNIHC